MSLILRIRLPRDQLSFKERETKRNAETKLISSIILLLDVFFCSFPDDMQAPNLREDRNSPEPPSEGSEITVTIKLDWNVESVGKPIPPPYTTNVPEGTFLVKIMNKAADEDHNSPFNKYTSTYYGRLGHYINSIYGIQEDPTTNTYWMIYDGETGELTPLGVDSYKPQDGSTTIFRLETRVNNECATAAETESPTDQE